MTQAFNLSQLANNLNTSGQLDATDGLTGAVPVANGGTGQTSLSANGVLLGNGTSGVQTVAPSTAGNLLVSNGTTWVSQAPTGGGVTSLNGQTGAITNTSLNAIGSYFIGYDISVTGRNNSTFTAPGTTTAGSNLRNNAANFASAFGDQSIGTTYLGGVLSSAGLSGTWRRLSAYQAANSSEGGYYVSFLFVRIS